MLRTIKKQSRLNKLTALVSAAVLSLGMGCSKPNFDIPPEKRMLVENTSFDYNGISVFEKPVYSSNNSSKKKQSKMSCISNLIAANVVDIAVHESGHTIVHSAMGTDIDRSYFLPSIVTGVYPHVSTHHRDLCKADYIMYDNEGNVTNNIDPNGSILAMYSYDDGYSEKIKVKSIAELNDLLASRERELESKHIAGIIGGPVATLALAETSSYMLRRGNISKENQPLWATITLMSRAHALYAPFQQESSGGTKSDFSIISEHSGVEQGYFAAAGMLYTLLNHKRIAKEFRVAQGLETFETDKPYTFTVIPTFDSVNFSLSVNY
jgi:hypothetical protein